MKKIVILTIAILLFASSCLPAPATEVPTSSVDLDATAAVFVQQTLDAFPTATVPPTNTPVVINETATPSVTSTVQIETATLDQTSIVGTGTTAVTSTGTLTTATTTITAAQTTNSGTLTTTLTFTPNILASATETLHPRFYGTLPPNLPYNGIDLINRSKAEAYISLQGTTADGYTTILEYPVGKLISIQAPIGKYKYVAWVGGNKLQGSFVLDGNNELRITIFKDRIEIKKR
jgi:hypothetical protein